MPVLRALAALIVEMRERLRTLQARYQVDDRRARVARWLRATYAAAAAEEASCATEPADGQYLYHVESKTRAGLFHVVDVHRLTCNCEAGRCQRGCWHLRLALAWHDWRKRQEAQHAAASSGMTALRDAVA